jgi:hypothetical protein
MTPLRKLKGALWYLAPALLAGYACLSTVACTQLTQSNALVAVVHRNLSLNSLGRYMSPRGGCCATQFPRWERYPTEICSYEAVSHVRLSVIVLNPNREQLARWFVTACTDAHARYVMQCSERLDLLTTCQSGAQFPVAGDVDEGKIYTFRDGVTVRMKGLPSTIVPKSDVQRDAPE